MHIARPQSFNPPSLCERRVQQSFPFIRRQCAKLSSWTARWLAARRRVSSARCICSAVLGRETWKFIPVEIHAFEFLAGWRAKLSFLRWQRNAAYLARLIVYKKAILLESSLRLLLAWNGDKKIARDPRIHSYCCALLFTLFSTREVIDRSLSFSLFFFTFVSHVQTDGKVYYRFNMLDKEIKFLIYRTRTRTSILLTNISIITDTYQHE